MLRVVIITICMEKYEISITIYKFAFYTEPVTSSHNIRWQLKVTYKS